MTEDQLVPLAITGWCLALAFVGLWLGERRMRIFIQNYTTFGGKPIKRAVVHREVDGEDALEETLDRIEGIAGTKRTGRTDGSTTAYDEKTLQNGIEFLMEEAREQGARITREQARDEAERMLTAQDGAM